MKNIIYALVACIVSAAPAVADTSYYRHLVFRETPFSAHEGVHPITAEKAQSTAHYRFDYDSEGRVRTISHSIGDKIIASNGNWDSFTWFGPKVEITYEGKRETHHFFNSENQPMAVHGGVFRAEFELDKGGMRRSLAYFNESGEAVAGAWGAHKYLWSLDAENRVKEQRLSLAGEQVRLRPNLEFFEIRITFGADDRIIMMQNYGQDSTPTNNASGAGIDRIYYDAQGNFVRWAVYDKDNNPVEGNAPNVHVGEHLYDLKGNKIGMRGFDRQGRRMIFATGDYNTQMNFDERGNAVSMAHYNKAGETVRKTLYEYTDDGRYYSWVKSVDGNDKLKAAPYFGGAAAIHLKRDPKNPLKMERVFYSAAMEVVKPGGQ